METNNDEDNSTGLFAGTEGAGNSGTLTLQPNSSGTDLTVNLSGQCSGIYGRLWEW